MNCELKKIFKYSVCNFYNIKRYKVTSNVTDNILNLIAKLQRSRLIKLIELN